MITAIGKPSRPVTAIAVLTTKVTTVNGATDDAMAAPIANGPSRFAAKACDTLPGAVRDGEADT
ncbi:hypothetical protein Abr02nite_84310 [Paractinoplanes brasiliensis]|nr:hypothetical protein Abr02nite_84310 [Actinoplanes brasiliensis]